MTDYSNALNGHSRPLETLRARISKVKHTDQQVQAWVQAVADATEQHAQLLERILTKYSVNEQDLGTLGSAWDAVASVLLANAQAEASAARKLRSEVHQPLRLLARAYEQTTSAAVADATYSATAATEVQDADLNRAQGIRDALVRMQTLFVDSAQDVQKAAEKSSSTLLSFNPSDEPESFVAQIVSGIAPTDPEPAPRGAARSLRAASSQTFIHNTAVRKPSRLSMAESQTSSSDKKRSGLRAKVGSIFRKPKNGAARMSPTRATSDRFSERFSERSEREVSESPSANGPRRTPSVRQQPQQPTSTQPPDFGLKPSALSSNPIGENEPLSNIRNQRDLSSSANGSAGPPVIPRSPEAPGVLTPTPRGAQTNDSTDSQILSPSGPFQKHSTSESNPDIYGAPSVPPPRGGRKINSIYFSGVSAAPRESVVEIPEDRAIDFSGNMSSLSLASAQLTGSGVARRPIKRDFTGQQSQQHPQLPLVENGPAASILESITAKERNGKVEDVFITGDVRFASAVPLDLQIINERHLASFTPTAALTKKESGIYSFAPTSHLPGSTLATYTGNFPPLLPLTITPQWQVTENQTRLIIYYQLAEKYPLDTVTLHDLNIAVTVTGGLAKSAHSKPLATFSREKQRVTWRFTNAVELRKGEPERLVCQFVTNGSTYESPQGVEARFEIQNAPTAIGLETKKDDDTWVAVSTAATAYTQRHTATSQ